MQFLQRFGSRTKHHVVLLGRPGCHLCEEARSLLDQIDVHGNLVIQEVDISADRDLLREYDLYIPVVLIDGHTEYRAPLDPRVLKRALR